MKTIMTKIVILVLLLSFTSLSFAGEVLYYDTNNVGTPVAMWNSSGHKVWEAEYFPYGQEYRVVTDVRPNSKKFIAKEKDDETGLSYFGARYYDDQSIRFLVPDPVKPVDPFTSRTNTTLLENPQRLNRYGYGLNNPYRYVDPDGRDPKDPRTGKTNEVTRCHVETHNDPAKELIGVSIMATAVAGEAAAAVAGRVISGVAGRFAAKEGANVAEDFFAGTKYSNKVLKQMEQGDLHSFPKSVEGFQNAGKVSQVKGGDGITREMLKIEGGYKGKGGTFEFMKEADGTINHRFFRPKSE